MASQAARTAYITDMKAQLQELLDRYDPALLWFDGDWFGEPSSPTLQDWWLQSDGIDLYNWLIARKPGLDRQRTGQAGPRPGRLRGPEFGVPPRRWRGRGRRATR